MRTASLGIICQQPILRDALSGLFSGESGFVVRGTGATALELAAETAGNALDIVVLHLPDSRDVSDSIAAMLRKAPTCRILIMADETETDLAGKLLNAGAAGYISVNCTGAGLAEAARTILRGETFISSQIASRVIGALRAAALRKAAQKERRFSVREQQIILHLLKGKTNKAIAVDLKLSEKTVKHYMTLLMQKLAARNRLELAMTLRSEERDFSAPILN